MSWNKVQTVLLDYVVSLMRNEVRGKVWVSKLERCEEGSRLGVCIAIDVLSGALEPQVFADILERVDENKANARHAFAEVVGDPPDPRLICASRFNIPALGGADVYVRLLELGAFIDFYVGPVYHKSSLDPEDVNDVRTDFFTGDATEHWPDITVEWSGRFPRVFVTALDELESLLAGVPDGERGAVANDAFGFGLEEGVGEDNKPEFVAVRYTDSAGAEFYQPTTFDVSWVDAGGYYLSFGDEDKWGRTQSCSGLGGQVRERIHRGFTDSLSRYKGLYIGVASVPAADRNELLEEGYRRLLPLLPVTATA